MTTPQDQNKLRKKAADEALADKYISRGGGAPLPDLTELTDLEYEQKRKSLADDMGVRVGFLDEKYKAAHRGAASSDGFCVSAVELWPDPVDGADLLDAICKVLDDHLVLPSGASEAVALWSVFTHAHDAFCISPILAVTSPTPECGKTTLQNLLSGLVPKPLTTSNITGAALFRTVDLYAPTLLADEGDTFLTEAKDLRGILNSGHSIRSAFVVRTTGDNHEPKRFKTWCPKSIALIGRLHPTLSSRSIHIELRRMLPTEKVKPLPEGRLEHLEPLCSKAARWAADNMDKLRGARPELSSSLHGRAADNWRPLLAIADMAGGRWPDLARRIAEKLGGRRTEQVAGIKLLEDIRGIFEDMDEDRIASLRLIDALIQLETSPWCEWGPSQRPITQRQLAKLLEPFGVTPRQLWIGGINQRGYSRLHFGDAFARYLGAPIR